MFPCGDSLKSVVDGFEQKWGYPRCAGAIDGSHIPISVPVECQSDYYNRTGWYSIVVQAVVDHQYLIRDVCIGWPGSVHDARIFANSQIYNKITQEGILKEAVSRTILNADIPVHLIGDSACVVIETI